MYDAAHLNGKPGIFHADSDYEQGNNRFGGNPDDDGNTSEPMLAFEIHVQ